MAAEMDIYAVARIAGAERLYLTPVRTEPFWSSDVCVALQFTDRYEAEQEARRYPGAVVTPLHDEH